MVLVEPYSRAKATGLPTTVVTGVVSPPEKRYNQMTADDKIKKCCRDFNRAQGCSRPAPKCR